MDAKKYRLIIDGDADSVFPPVEFGDYISAVKHGIRVMDALSGASALRIEGSADCGPLDADFFRTMKAVIKYHES